MGIILRVNMILEKEAEAQKLLELCLVQMPNQNLKPVRFRAEPRRRTVLAQQRHNLAVDHAQTRHKPIVVQLDRTRWPILRPTFLASAGQSSTPTRVSV